MRDQYRLPAGKLARPRECLRALSLSGGGYRGLFTAKLLAMIENMDEYQGEPIGPRFDVIAGTSVGGLIAAALALGVSARTVYDLLAEWGPAIFPPLFLKPVRKVFSRKVFDAEPLERAIVACLGASAKMRLSDVDKPLMLTTVSWSRGELRLLRSRGLAQGAADACTLLEATHATSAAPAHFPAQDIDGDRYLDGGLAANCPDLHGLTEARRYGLPVRMLSVGTAGVTRQSVPDRMPLRGLLWAKPALELAIQAQERIAQAECERQLRGDYLRLNSKPGIDQLELRDLDCADRNTTVALTTLAESRFNELKLDNAQKQKLDRLLSPVPI